MGYLLLHGCGFVGEASCGAQEAGGGYEAEPLWRGWLGVAVETLAHDRLDATDVDEVEAQRAPAGGVDPVVAVFVHQAQ